MKISILGAGYVGLSLGCLLAKHYEVTILDQDLSCITKINQRISPVKNYEISTFLSPKDDDLTLAAIMAVNAPIIYPTSDFIIIALPTPQQAEQPHLNTHDLEHAIDIAIKHSTPDTPIIIKSTVPMGFTEQINMTHQTDRIFYCPEFLTEAHPIRDTRNPSRLIVSGINAKRLPELVDLFTTFCSDPYPPIFQLHSRDAEAVKVFSNAYLAMRVAFFNELDTFATKADLDPFQVIQAMGADPRIQDIYNNPSFGFKGTCFPKDLHYVTHVLNAAQCPSPLINAIPMSNSQRTQFIVADILKQEHHIIGIYRPLSTEADDNSRASITHAVMEELQAQNAHLVIFEPTLKTLSGNYANSRVIRNFDVFAQTADIIVADRVSSELQPYLNKVYSRDTSKS